MFPEGHSTYTSAGRLQDGKMNNQKLWQKKLLLWSLLLLICQSFFYHQTGITKYSNRTIILPYLKCKHVTCYR